MNIEQIDEKEVRWRLARKELKTTEELYEFGLKLFKEGSDDVRRLNTKGAAMAACAGGVMTLLAISAPSWASLISATATCFVFAAGVCALSVANLGIRSIALQKYDRFSTNEHEWLRAECLDDPEQLRKYRIVTIWTVLQSQRVAHAEKDRWLRMAHFLLIATGVFLIIALLSSILV